MAWAGRFPVRCARHAATAPKLGTKTLTLTVGSWFKIWMKILLTNLRISFKIESKTVPKPIKSDPLGCLGGVWRPFWTLWAVLDGVWRLFWSQEGPEGLNYEKMFDFLRIWGSSGGPKWNRNRQKQCSKIDSFFKTILKHVLINQSWVDFGSKNLSKMMVPRDICSTLCWYAKSVI